MTGTGVMTAVERRGVRLAIGCVVILILLMGSGVCVAEVLNPSFETTYMGTPYPRLLPQGWYHADHASFNSYCTNSWSTDGTLSAALLSRIGKAVSPGNYESFYQFVDLTGIASIEFDIRLVALPAGAFAHFEASLLVDGVPLWSQNAAGVYLDQQVSVSGMAGWHRIEMCNTARDTGTFTLAYWTQWDNLRLIEGPKTIPAVIDLEPDTLRLHCPGKWIVCFIELPAGYDVNDIDEATVTLQDIPAYLGKEGWGKLALNKREVTDRDGDGVPERMARFDQDKEGWGKLALHKRKVMDHDGDGIPERIVRFDQDAVRAIVQPPEAILTVKGNLVDKTPFEGSATIKVVDKLAELKEKLKGLKAKVQDVRDKRNDEKNECGDIKDMRDKLKDAIGKCQDKDDKGARKK
jgi:hypothetical protein